ncbi:MAG: lytic transglycosylase domain-containing protein [Proteobacteria bacterium]|nr:lytic transglycosylase domain-containing protein [Pseudomonadota bacterium]
MDVRRRAATPSPLWAEGAQPWWRLHGLVIALCLAAPTAHAELWGYVDGARVAHVAPRQVDARYHLVLGDRDAPAIAVPGKADRASGLLTWVEIAPEALVLQPVLRQAAREQGIDPELLQAIVVVESGYNRRAVSPRGAIGLMQLTPETADRYATPAERKQPAAERLLDPLTNLRAGARMLADLTRRYGGIDIALAAWNAGEGTVRKAAGKMPPIDETRAHVQLVLELYWALLQNDLARHVTQLEIHADGG